MVYTPSQRTIRHNNGRKLKKKQKKTQDRNVILLYQF